MAASKTAGSMNLQVVGDYYHAVLKTYATGGTEAVFRTHGDVLAAMAMALLLLLVLVLLLVTPSKRKVVRRRVVRVRRHAVPSESSAVPVESEPAPENGAGAQPARPSVRVARWVVPVACAAIVIAGFAAAYVVTGSNRYCGASCHQDDKRVVAALGNPHADCIDCHESGPLSGGVARLRMSVEYVRSRHTGVGQPIDPRRCLGCHDDIRDAVVTSGSGIRVSHKEIVSGGMVCADCHRDVGHRKGRSLVRVMARCGLCHDGKKASSACSTCHVGGSPLETARNVRASDPVFMYPQVQVANRDCARCHGENKKCINCHNGFVLPHPASFVNGGHAPLAAFDRRERCYKCHSLAWCGSGKCHHAFTPHDPDRWPVEHRSGTSEQCGSCHIAWKQEGSFCDVCHAAK